MMRAIANRTAIWFDIFSGLCMALPFLVPLYMAELVCFAYVPLIVVRRRRPLQSGLVIGAVFYTLYCTDIIIFVAQYGHSALKWLVPLGLIALGSCYTAVWAWLVIRVSARWPYGGFVIATMLWWWYIDRHFFLLYGNTLQNPVLPLLERPAWQWLLYSTHEWVLWVLIINGNYFAAWSITHRQWRFLCLYLIVLIGMATLQVPSFSTIATDDIALCSPGQPYTDYHEALTWCREQDGMYHNAILIFPESMIPSYEGYEDLASYFSGNNILLIGTHSQKKGGCYNTLVQVSNGRITQDYDKRILLPLAESVPSWSASIFFKDAEPFASGKEERTFSIKGRSFYPFICSEFFFNTAQMKALCCHCDGLLVVAHDAWFFHDYFSRLMMLYARKVCVDLKKPGMYVAYRYLKLWWF